MNANELMGVQAETLYVLDEEKRIIRVNERDPNNCPVLFIGKTHEAAFTYLHRDLPQILVEEIRQTSVESVNIMNLCNIIDRYKRVKDVWIGPAYGFDDQKISQPVNDIVDIDEANKHLLEKHYGQMIRELEERSPIVAYILDGNAVSLCCSARKSNKAVEASLATAHPYRGKGLAEKVVSVWSMEVSKQGLIPLYSTSWDNLNSQKVAQKLGLVQYGVDFSVSI
jgi:hypothetical protein